jgi:MFS transporter, ACS family, DAL5 transporter family protein
LSYFYKHHELSIRLGFFWTALSISDTFAALVAAGLLRLRGVDGRAGWRWLFLIEVSVMPKEPLLFYIAD